MIRRGAIAAGVMAGVAAVALVGGGVAPSAQASASAAAATATWKVDAVHSSVVFRIKHGGTSYFWGRFNDPAGEINIDESDLASSLVKIELQAEKIDTANQGRDNHLRGPDFFNAKQYPTTTFTGTGAKRVSDGVYEVSGELTLLGKSRPLTVRLEKTGSIADHPRMGTREGWESTFVIKRTDFGMDYGVEAGALGDEVKVVVGLQTIKG